MIREIIDKAKTALSADSLSNGLSSIAPVTLTVTFGLVTSGVIVAVVVVVCA